MFGQRFTIKDFRNNLEKSNYSIIELEELLNAIERDQRSWMKSCKENYQEYSHLKIQWLQLKIRVIKDLLEERACKKCNNKNCFICNIKN